MTPERIAEIRTMPHDNWRIVRELLDALDAANAELQRLRSSQDVPGGRIYFQPYVDALAARIAELEDRLRSSPAPVVGGVPEYSNFERNEQIRKYGGDPDFDAPVFQAGWDLLASRLPALKPGEVVVNSEEYAALLDFAERIVPIRDNLSGISWVGNLKDVFAAYDNWYAIRIAQATTNRKEG